MNPEFPSSGLPERAEAVVVGGGIAGTSVAYHLARAGVDVALIERGRVGAGATSAAVGVLSPPLRQPFHETVRFLGPDAAADLWHFAAASIDGLAEALARAGAETEAELDRAGGFLLSEPHSDHEVEDAFAALQTAGFPVEWLTRADIRRCCEGAQGFSGGFRLDGGGSIAPGATAVALARTAADFGAGIYENIDVHGVERAGDDFRVGANGNHIACRNVVYATHVDTRRFSGFLGQEIVPIRGQGFRTDPLDRMFDGAFATHWKLNVWRQDRAGRLIVSGWRHDAWARAYGHEQPEVDSTLQVDLVRWFETAFPHLAPLSIRDRWSGVFGWTGDFLPLVGPLPASEGEYVSSGFSGGGLPFAFGAGATVAAQITGGSPPGGSTLFAPDRFARP